MALALCCCAFVTIKSLPSWPRKLWQLPMPANWLLPPRLPLPAAPAARAACCQLPRCRICLLRVAMRLLIQFTPRCIWPHKVRRSGGACKSKLKSLRYSCICICVCIFICMQLESSVARLTERQAVADTETALQIHLSYCCHTMKLRRVRAHY